MTTVDEIMDAIERLTFDERAELARRLHGWQDDDWDRQIAADLAAGRLDELIRRADEDVAAGRFGRPREISDQLRLPQTAGAAAGAGQANSRPAVSGVAG